MSRVKHKRFRRTKGTSSGKVSGTNPGTEPTKTNKEQIHGVNNSK